MEKNAHTEEKHGALREVSFIDEKVKEWLDREAPEKGLCVRRFKADFIVAGLADMKVGDRIRIDEHGPGGTEAGVSEAGGSEADMTEAGGTNIHDFEITLMGKRCFPECELFREKGEKCPLATGVAFGKRLVAAGGIGR